MLPELPVANAAPVPGVTDGAGESLGPLLGGLGVTTAAAAAAVADDPDPAAPPDPPKSAKKSYPP